MRLLGSSPNSWQTCYWGWEQSITALRHGNLGRWPVPEAPCGSAYDPIGQVGNELTDASFHASFKLVLIVVSPARTKRKHFLLTWTWIWLAISYLKCCWEFWLKAAHWTYSSHATNIFITCYSLPNLTKSRVVVVQSFSHVWLCVTLWTAACQASLHHLLELGQTHVHWVSDAIQPSHSLSSAAEQFWAIKWNGPLIPTRPWMNLTWLGGVKETRCRRVRGVPFHS